MTGLRGLLLTSATGAKLTCTPSARDFDAGDPRCLADEAQLLVAGGAERHRRGNTVAPAMRKPTPASKSAVFEQRHLRQRLQAIDHATPPRAAGRESRCRRRGSAGRTGRLRRAEDVEAADVMVADEALSNRTRAVGAEEVRLDLGHEELADLFVDGQLFRSARPIARRPDRGWVAPPAAAPTRRGRPQRQTAPARISCRHRPIRIVRRGRCRA